MFRGIVFTAGHIFRHSSYHRLRGHKHRAFEQRKRGSYTEIYDEDNSAAADYNKHSQRRNKGKSFLRYGRLYS